ncbi:uncharacterized protein LOC125220405 [Salvia hispanica]|uniref:uncharacterized protein LOC125220405 n=1 Tax=Salvia hispanica TaxID=49212 RepID=UPI00200928F3|nr:uncharacterized protein LOC125220405 [Salvia hispanica]
MVSKCSSKTTIVFIVKIASRDQYAAALTTSKPFANINLTTYTPWNALRGGRHPISSISKNWELHSTAQTEDVILSDEDKKTWESCRQALSAYGFGTEEEDKILGKAFGHIHSPYWGEERKKEVPKFEVVNEILSYLKDLGLTDDDLGKVLKKFPEVLGCNLENELKENVQILDNQWGIKALVDFPLRPPPQKPRDNTMQMKVIGDLLKPVVYAEIFSQ